MPQPRQRVSSGSPFELTIGFSRAVRVGPWIAVSGTAPIAPDGSAAHPGDVYAQTRRCLEIMLRAVEEAGGTAASVLRTRIMLVDIDTWREAARAHGEVFGEIRPACTFVEISRLIDSAWLVETEADAYVDEAPVPAPVTAVPT
jgi:enamine deaminase RidA (YjgF/YER057c/UK114 family)